MEGPKNRKNPLAGRNSNGASSDRQSRTRTRKCWMSHGCRQFKSPGTFCRISSENPCAGLELAWRRRYEHPCPAALARTISEKPHHTFDIRKTRTSLDAPSEYRCYVDFRSRGKPAHVSAALAC